MGLGKKKVTLSTSHSIVKGSILYNASAESSKSSFYGTPQSSCCLSCSPYFYSACPQEKSIRQNKKETMSNTTLSKHFTFVGKVVQSASTYRSSGNVKLVLWVDAQGKCILSSDTSHTWTISKRSEESLGENTEKYLTFTKAVSRVANVTSFDGGQQRLFGTINVGTRGHYTTRTITTDSADQYKVASETWTFYLNVFGPLAGANGTQVSFLPVNENALFLQPLDPELQRSGSTRPDLPGRSSNVLESGTTGIGGGDFTDPAVAQLLGVSPLRVSDVLSRLAAQKGSAAPNSGAMNVNQAYSAIKWQNESTHDVNHRPPGTKPSLDTRQQSATDRGLDHHASNEAVEPKTYMQHTLPSRSFPYVGKMTQRPTGYKNPGQIRPVLSIDDQGESEISDNPKDVWKVPVKRMDGVSAEQQYFIFTKSGQGVGFLQPFDWREKRRRGIIIGNNPLLYHHNAKIKLQHAYGEEHAHGEEVLKVASDIWTHYLKTYSESAGQPGTLISCILVGDNALLLRCEDPRYARRSSRPPSRSEISSVPPNAPRSVTIAEPAQLQKAAPPLIPQGTSSKGSTQLQSGPQPSQNRNLGAGARQKPPSTIWIDKLRQDISNSLSIRDFSSATLHSGLTDAQNMDARAVEMKVRQLHQAGKPPGELSAYADAQRTKMESFHGHQRQWLNDLINQRSASVAK